MQFDLDDPETLEKIKEENKFNEKNLIIYAPPGVGDELSARFLHSFAYINLRERAPGFLRDLIAFLPDREPEIVKECGEYAHFDLKRTVWSLELLLDEILNNKPFDIIRVKAPDTQSWNEFLNALGDDKRNWFSAVWLHAECYMYRRIWAIFQRSETLVNFDYFGEHKMQAAKKMTSLMKTILLSTRDLKRSQDIFQRLLKLTVWGNRTDLSITMRLPDARLFDLLAEYDAHLLVDESEAVWNDLTQAYDPVYVDIVCDNGGFELFSDLVLADYIVRTGLAQRVRFHVKAIPWYISDASHRDFRWMQRYFARHESPVLQAFGARILQRIRDRSFILCEKTYFWTSAHDCSHMKQVAPCLYVYLSQAALVIFKGDVNYRKLLGDIKYNSTDSFSDCLRGFLPTSVCALRAIKSDNHCGLSVCQVEWLDEDNPKWNTTGEKAVVQLAVKHRLSGDIIVKL